MESDTLVFWAFRSLVHEYKNVCSYFSRIRNLTEQNKVLNILSETRKIVLHVFKMYCVLVLLGACFVATAPALPVGDLCTQPYIEHLNLCRHWAEIISKQLANYSVVLDECWSTHLPKLQSTDFYNGLNIYLTESIRLNATKFSYVTANNNEAQFARDYMFNLRHFITELHQAVDSLGVQTTPTMEAPVISQEKSSDYVYTVAWRISSSLRAALVDWESYCHNAGRANSNSK